MALEFTCSKCGTGIITKYLRPHDIARCPVCKAEVVVPENAAVTEKEPPYLQLKTTGATAVDVKVEAAIPSFKIGKPYPGVLQTGMLFLVYLCAIFLFGMIGTCAGASMRYKLHDQPLFIYGIGTLALVVVLWYGYKRTGKPFGDVFAIGSLRSHKWLPFMMTNLALLGFRIFFAAPALFLYEHASESQQMIFKSILEDITSVYAIGFWPSIIYVVMIGPIVEEMIFRGLLLHGYLRRYSTGAAIVISSLLFALVHGNIFLMIAAFFLGILLAWLFVLTRSLLACVLTHMIFNLTAVAGWYCFSSATSIDRPSPGSGSFVFFASILTAISLIIVIATICVQVNYSRRHRLQPET